MIERLAALAFVKTALHFLIQPRLVPAEAYDVRDAQSWRYIPFICDNVFEHTSSVRPLYLSDSD